MSRALFFDLDGTLTDPKPGITGCIRYALERLGEPVPTADELTWCIGPPLFGSFSKLIGTERAQTAIDLYRERYRDVGLYENELYAGIDEALGRLRSEGAAIYVASSKPLVYVRQILDHFELSAHFTGIFGSELDGTRTDKIELLAFALGQSGVEASDATMIGDRAFDAIGARANGMPFLGALYGYGSLDELREAGATRWVEHPDQLASALIGGGA